MLQLAAHLSSNIMAQASLPHQSTTDAPGFKPEIRFFRTSEGSLSVTIETKRLHLRSVVREDLDNYASLFGDPAVMEKFGSGQTKSREEVQKRFSEWWLPRWQSHDPYSGLAVFLPTANVRDGEFIGHAALGHSDKPGEAEVAFLLHKQHWDKGYASEVAAVIFDYARATVENGFTLERKQLEKIVATARVDNVASWRIMEKLGMHLESKVEKYGAQRLNYGIKMNELPSRCA